MEEKNYEDKYEQIVRQLTTENENLREENQKLKEDNQKYIERNKLNKKDKQSLKMKIENINNELSLSNKACKILEDENKNQDSKLKENLYKIAELEKQIQIRNEEIVLLKEDNVKLKLFEKDAIKILCFTKGGLDTERFPTKNVEIKKTWINEDKDSISWEIYDEIWIITKDFTYNDCCEIKQNAKCKVKKYLNVKNIKNIKVGDV